MITVRRCIIADHDHSRSIRQYAHTYHIKGNVICVTGEWLFLPLEHQMGLIAHEIGHLLVGHTDHSEEEADRLGGMFFGIRIRYRDSVYGNRLQYLSSRDSNKVYGWMLDNVTFEGKIFK